MRVKSGLRVLSRFHSRVKGTTPSSKLRELLLPPFFIPSMDYGGYPVYCKSNVNAQIVKVTLTTTTSTHNGIAERYGVKANVGNSSSIRQF